MALTKVFILVPLILGIKFVASQNDFLMEPWVDVVTPPAVTPSPIPINSEDVVPYENAFNRFLSFSLQEIDLLTNSGTFLYARCTTNPRSYTVGGALGFVNYIDVYTIFLWDINLGTAGGTLDGVGKPLEVVRAYRNNKYTSDSEAQHNRDGWFLVSIRVNVEKDAPDNEQFSLFAEKMSEVLEAGNSTDITGYDKLWLYPKRIHQEEYCYPGSFLDPSTKTRTYSSTVCITLDEYLPTISLSQFMNTFGQLTNSDGQSYNSIMKLQMASANTTIAGFGPVIIDINPSGD